MDYLVYLHRCFLIILVYYSDFMRSHTQSFKKQSNDSHIFCCHWSLNGHCKLNENWMQLNCPHACANYLCQAAHNNSHDGSKDSGLFGWPITAPASKHHKPKAKSSGSTLTAPSNRQSGDSLTSLADFNQSDRSLKESNPPSGKVKNYHSHYQSNFDSRPPGYRNSPPRPNIEYEVKVMPESTTVRSTPIPQAPSPYRETSKTLPRLPASRQAGLSNLNQWDSYIKSLSAGVLKSGSRRTQQLSAQTPETQRPPLRQSQPPPSGETIQAKKLDEKPVLVGPPQSSNIQPPSPPDNLSKIPANFIDSKKESHSSSYGPPSTIELIKTASTTAAPVADRTRGPPSIEIPKISTYIHSRRPGPPTTHHVRHKINVQPTQEAAFEFTITTELPTSTAAYREYYTVSPNAISHKRLLDKNPSMEHHPHIASRPYGPPGSASKIESWQAPIHIRDYTSPLRRPGQTPFIEYNPRSRSSIFNNTHYKSPSMKPKIPSRSVIQHRQSAPAAQAFQHYPLQAPPKRIHAPAKPYTRIIDTVLHKNQTQRHTVNPPAHPNDIRRNKSNFPTAVTGPTGPPKAKTYQDLYDEWIKKFWGVAGFPSLYQPLYNGANAKKTLGRKLSKTGVFNIASVPLLVTTPSPKYSYTTPVPYYRGFHDSFRAATLPNAFETQKPSPTIRFKPPNGSWVVLKSPSEPQRRHKLSALKPSWAYPKNFKLGMIHHSLMPSTTPFPKTIYAIPTQGSISTLSDIKSRGTYNGNATTSQPFFLPLNLSGLPNLTEVKPEQYHVDTNKRKLEHRPIHKYVNTPIKEFPQTTYAPLLSTTTQKSSSCCDWLHILAREKNCDSVNWLKTNYCRGSCPLVECRNGSQQSKTPPRASENTNTNIRQPVATLGKQPQSTAVLVQDQYDYDDDLPFINYSYEIKKISSIKDDEFSPPNSGKPLDVDHPIEIPKPSRAIYKQTRKPLTGPSPLPIKKSTRITTNPSNRIIEASAGPIKSVKPVANPTPINTVGINRRQRYRPKQQIRRRAKALRRPRLRNRGLVRRYPLSRLLGDQAAALNSVHEEKVHIEEPLQFDDLSLDEDESIDTDYNGVGISESEWADYTDDQNDETTVKSKEYHTGTLERRKLTNALVDTKTREYELRPIPPESAEIALWNEAKIEEAAREQWISRGRRNLSRTLAEVHDYHLHSIPPKPKEIALWNATSIEEAAREQWLSRSRLTLTSPSDQVQGSNRIQYKYSVLLPDTNEEADIEQSFVRRLPAIAGQLSSRLGIMNKTLEQSVWALLEMEESKFTSLCCFWASRGHCRKSREWMKKKCNSYCRSACAQNPSRPCDAEELCAVRRSSRRLRLCSCDQEHYGRTCGLEHNYKGLGGERCYDKDYKRNSTDKISNRKKL